MSKKPESEADLQEALKHWQENPPKEKKADKKRLNLSKKIFDSKFPSAIIKGIIGISHRAPLQRGEDF